jgi:hypothetical protein
MATIPTSIDTARFGSNIISAVSTQGELPFMITKGRFNAGTFIESIKRLLHGATGMVFLVDGHPIHKAKTVMRFIEG